MQLARPQLTVLLNALYDTDTTRITVSHPSDEVGELLSFELGEATASTVRIEQSLEEYADSRNAVNSAYGSLAVDELPNPRSYANALLAGGLFEPANKDEIDEFLDRNGHPDLTAGHKPVVAGFDTNLLPWRIADVLGLIPGREAPINGYALATGIRDELDWDYKRSETRALEEAFGPEFEELWNQPAGARREGRLGENYYRRLRDHRYGDEFVTETGDDAIIKGYEQYQDESRKDVLLFSNDRDFVERAESHRVRAQRVEYPDELPHSTKSSWTSIRAMLYVMTVLFGVLTLPKATLYGVWKGKGGQAWQEEALEVDCRSPKVEELVCRDMDILDAAATE